MPRKQFAGEHPLACFKRIGYRCSFASVRTSEGTRRAMLFPRAILKAGWDADALVRDALTIRGR